MRRATVRDLTCWLALLLIVGVGAALRTRTFTDPWNSGHGAWGGAFYGNVARNFLRYDAGSTALAPVVNSGIVDPSRFELYYHHPPLTMWLTAVSFRIFGVQEWAARLAPLVFALLTIVLVFRMAWAMFGRRTALWAAAFLAVLPLEAYYSTHLDPNSSMSIFFTTLAVEGYRRWRGSGRTRDYALCATALVLGCMTGWFTYLILPGIGAHFWFTARGAAPAGAVATTDRTAWVRAALLPVFAVAVLGLFFLHRELAFATGRTEVFDALGDRFLKRTVGFEMGRGSIMVQYLARVVVNHTYVPVALTLAWAALFLRDVRRGRARAAEWYIAILLSYGALYALAFPGHLPGHDFFVRTYGPAIALASAVAMSRVASAIALPPVRVAALAALFLVASGTSVLRLRTMYWSEDAANGARLRGYADAVASVTSPRDPVLLPVRADALMQFYLDRPTRFDLDTPEKLESEAAALERPYVIAVPEWAARDYPAVLDYLLARYREHRRNGLILFQGANGAAD